MTLEKELQEDLGRRLAAADFGSLCRGREQADEKDVVWELLENQFVILRVLAAMNGVDPNPKTHRQLLDG